MQTNRLYIPEPNLIPYAPTTLAGCGSVLVLAPHPDDEILGCGGALALHCAAGDRVRVVIVTDGSQQPGQASLSRLAESHQAGTALGYTDIECWELSDRSLAFDATLANRILHLLETSDAKLVYGPSPYEIHPDHRAVSWFLADAAQLIGGDRKLVGYEVSGTLRPNLLLDISSVFSQKRQAMNCFSSQLGLRPYDQYIEGLNRYRTYTLPPDVIHAEGYISCCFSNTSLAWLGDPTTDTKTALASVHQEAVHLHDRLVELENLAGVCAGHLQRLNQEVQASIQRERSLDQQINTLQTTTSWRITAPLRALKRQSQALKAKLLNLTTNINND